MAEFERIILEREDNIAIIKFSNPPLNRLGLQMLREFHQALDLLENDDSVRAILVTGDGYHFSGGADIPEYAHLKKEDFEEYAALGHKTASRIEYYPKAIIAAGTGKCLGASQMIYAACDIHIAGENIDYWDGSVYYGLIGSMSMAGVRAAKWLGRNKVLEFMLMGKHLNGRELVDYGVAAICVPDDQVLETGKRYAKRVAQAAPIAVAYLKREVATSLNGTYEEALAVEAELAEKIKKTSDSKLGMEYLEKLFLVDDESSVELPHYTGK